MRARRVLGVSRTVRKGRIPRPGRAGESFGFSSERPGKSSGMQVWGQRPGQLGGAFFERKAMRGRDYDGEQTGCDARAGRRRHVCDVLRCGAGSIWLPAAALAARGAVFFHVELERHRLVRHPDGGRERVKIPLWRHQLRRRGRGSGCGPGRRAGRPAGAEGEGRRREGRGREKARGQGNRRGAGSGKDGQQRHAGLLEGLPQRRLGAVHA